MTWLAKFDLKPPPENEIKWNLNSNLIQCETKFNLNNFFKLAGSELSTVSLWIVWISL